VIALPADQLEEQTAGLSRATWVVIGYVGIVLVVIGVVTAVTGGAMGY
jgi:hypothetical protein